MKFKFGDKVKSSSVKEGRIQQVHTGQLKGMYDVRVWNGQRHVGDITVDGRELKKKR